ncbi:MAG: hypothetical protein ABIO71_13720 [Caldimonas sp.]
MTDHAHWVEDVKRWYRASASAAAPSEGLPTDYGDDLGYEAAYPALQARYWPDAAAITTDR